MSMTGSRRTLDHLQVNRGRLSCGAATVSRSREARVPLYSLRHEWQSLMSTMIHCSLCADCGSDSNHFLIDSAARGHSQANSSIYRGILIPSSASKRRRKRKPNRHKADRPPTFGEVLVGRTVHRIHGVTNYSDPDIPPRAFPRINPSPCRTFNPNKQCGILQHRICSSSQQR